MGNVHNSIGFHENESKPSSSKNIQSTYEQFIIEHNKSYHLMNDDININISDHRRLVFVSLIGIYESWKECPSYILYSSLFIIPLKREWIYYPIKYKQQLQTSIIGELALFQTDEESINSFIELLKWKDSQGFVFWILNEYKEYTSSIAPFWKYVSWKLTNLYDPVTRGKYNGINEETITENIMNNKSKYTVEISSVVDELHSVKTMKYKTIQEIIYQSNPKSLNPITSFNAYIINNINTEIVKRASINMNCGDDENWWISSDYDPYDIDEGYQMPMK